MRSFVEIAAPRLASEAHGGHVATLDLGLAYLLAPQWQLDTALARGLTRHSVDSSWTVGLSAKF